VEGGVEGGGKGKVEVEGIGKRKGEGEWARGRRRALTCPRSYRYTVSVPVTDYSPNNTSKFFYLTGPTAGAQNIFFSFHHYMTVHYTIYIYYFEK
jgi:hypothetical protein